MVILIGLGAFLGWGISCCNVRMDWSSLQNAFSCRVRIRNKLGGAYDFTYDYSRKSAYAVSFICVNRNEFINDECFIPI